MPLLLLLLLLLLRYCCATATTATASAESQNTCSNPGGPSLTRLYLPPLLLYSSPSLTCFLLCQRLLLPMLLSQSGVCTLTMCELTVLLMSPRSFSGPDRSVELRLLAECAPKRVCTAYYSSPSLAFFQNFGLLLLLPILLSPSGVCKLTMCELTVLLMPPRSASGPDRSVGLRQLAVCATKGVCTAPLIAIPSPVILNMLFSCLGLVKFGRGLLGKYIFNRSS